MDFPGGRQRDARYSALIDLNDENPISSRLTSVPVRMLVAERTALPADVFELLVTDDDIRVAKGIVAHPALSADRLRTLAARHGPSLFRRLATNPHCDPDLLHHMARNATARRTYRAVAEHPNTRAETLLICLRDGTARRWAAQHPNLPTRHCPSA